MAADPTTTPPNPTSPPPAADAAAGDPQQVQLAFAMDLRLAGRDDDAAAVLGLTPDEFMAAGHGQDQNDPPEGAGEKPDTFRG